MRENLRAALAFIRADEGGYVERASEPGGAGKFGVSFAVFAAWRAKNKQPVPTFADLKAMSAEEADDIYTEQFAAPLRFDDLPAGADYALLDSGVNLGVSGAIRMAQGKALGFTGAAVTGHLDDKTLAAMKAMEPKALAMAICDGWLATKREGHGWETFGKGWTARHGKVLARVEAMTGSSA